MAARTDEELRAARARLVALDRERTELREIIVRLERETAGPHVATAEGRVALFTSLFRGRPDVFAIRWQSRTQPGRSGWAPRCDNEWQPGLCQKPRVKCAACDHRRFVPLSEAEVRKHLEGRQTVGIYPLLADETCWLVAIDLDGVGWREDAAAVRDAANDEGVPVLVERSRSGDGAHVWLLFSRPVAAAVARAIGSWLLTLAMRRRSLSIDSYDRLFPNQDTMPAGGFGNLIALPLQRARRVEGCTELLDENLDPYPDQWAYLATVTRMDAARAEQLARDAERSGGMLGLRHWGTEPPQTGTRPRLTPIDTRVTAILAGRLEIPTVGLAAATRDRLRRAAAFANPVFFERERVRLSTHMTPRVISCAEQVGDLLLLPRGCLNPARLELEEAGVELNVDDRRGMGSPIGMTFNGALTQAQDDAVAAVCEHDIGVLVAPPGAGKTVIAAALIARRGRSTVVLVHRRPLHDQWIKRLMDFLGIDRSAIGSPTEPGRSGIDVAMLQSLTRHEEPAELLAPYGHVVVDECHHVPAVSIERLLRQVPARYLTGLTATPRRRDGHHPIIEMQCGPVRHTLVAHDDVGPAPRRVVIERRTAFDSAVLPKDAGVQEVFGAIAADEARTRAIVEDVVAQVADGRFPLVLTERRDHLEMLAGLLEPVVPALVKLHGGIGIRARRQAQEILASDRQRVVLATGRYIGEGFDEPRLDTLVLAMPVAWNGLVTQYTGRLHRHHHAKHEIRIIDYVDREVPVLRRMYAKRRRAYARLGYRMQGELLMRERLPLELVPPA